MQKLGHLRVIHPPATTLCNQAILAIFFSTYCEGNEIETIYENL